MPSHGVARTAAWQLSGEGSPEADGHIKVRRACSFFAHERIRLIPIYFERNLLIMSADTSYSYGYLVMRVKWSTYCSINSLLIVYCNTNCTGRRLLYIMYEIYQ